YAGNFRPGERDFGFDHWVDDRAPSIWDARRALGRRRGHGRYWPRLRSHAPVVPGDPGRGVGLRWARTARPGGRNRPRPDLTPAHGLAVGAHAHRVDTLGNWHLVPTQGAQPALYFFFFALG